MNTVTVYGASDDLIEVRGAIEEEFGYSGHRHGDGDRGDLLAFSEGTILRIRFDGVWQIRPVCRGTAELRIEQTTEEDGTDEATLTGDIRWVVVGSDHARAKDGATA